jgi:hypothetical protein
MERFNLKKLNKVDGKNSVGSKSQIHVGSMALESSDDDVDINRPWKTSTRNIKISATVHLDYLKLKKHKPWFDERYSKLLDQRKDVKCYVYMIQAK